MSDCVIRCLMCGSFRPFVCVSHSEQLSLFLTSRLIVLMDYALLTTGFKKEFKKESKPIKPVCFHNMEYSSIKLLFDCHRGLSNLYIVIFCEKMNILENVFPYNKRGCFYVIVLFQEETL